MAEQQGPDEPAWVVEVRKRAVLLAAATHVNFTRSLNASYSLAPLLKEHSGQVLGIYCDALMSVTVGLIAEHVSASEKLEETAVQQMREKFKMVRDGLQTRTKIHVVPGG